MLAPQFFSENVIIGVELSGYFYEEFYLLGEWIVLQRGAYAPFSAPSSGVNQAKNCLSMGDVFMSSP